VSVEWDSLILGSNELNTAGPATENARRANLARTGGTNSRGAPAERIGLAGAATVNMSWRYGGVDVVSTLLVSTYKTGLLLLSLLLLLLLQKKYIVHKAHKAEKISKWNGGTTLSFFSSSTSRLEHSSSVLSRPTSSVNCC